MQLRRIDDTPPRYPVFVALPSVDLGGTGAVVVQQGLVGVIEGHGAAAAHLMSICGSIVAAHHLWDVAQGPPYVARTWILEDLILQLQNKNR